MLLSQNIFRILLILISLAGIFGLFALDLYFAPVTIEAGKIFRELEGKKVITQGRTGNEFVRSGTLFFELQNNGKIKAVIFSPSKEELDLVHKKSFVQVTGRIQKFRSELELIVDKVTAID